MPLEPLRERSTSNTNSQTMLNIVGNPPEWPKNSTSDPVSVYDGGKDKRESNLEAPLRLPVSPEEKRKYIIRFVENAETQVLDRLFAAAAATREELSLSTMVSSLPTVAPALWAKRTTGREVSPADFIRQHYGRTREDDTWDPMGLTRADLARLDASLYAAYGKLVERQPDRALPGLPPGPKRTRIDDPTENLERRKQLARERQGRYLQVRR